MQQIAKTVKPRAAPIIEIVVIVTGIAVPMAIVVDEYFKAASAA